MRRSGRVWRAVVPDDRHAVAVAQPGDAVVVKHGSYPESVTVDKQIRLIDHNAPINPAGKVNGLLVTGVGAAGTEVDGLAADNAIGKGILVQTTSPIPPHQNSDDHNDEGHDPPVPPDCPTQG